MGVVKAAEETQAPVIIQMYSRLFNTGTGKYMAPELATSRIAEIHAVTDAHLVLHGGSGIPDDQIRAAVKAFSLEKIMLLGADR